MGVPGKCGPPTVGVKARWTKTANLSRDPHLHFSSWRLQQPARAVPPSKEAGNTQRSYADARPLSRVRCEQASMVLCDWSTDGQLEPQIPPLRAAGEAAYICCSATPRRVLAFQVVVRQARIARTTLAGAARKL